MCAPGAASPARARAGRVRAREADRYAAPPPPPHEDSAHEKHEAHEAHEAHSHTQLTTLRAQLCSEREEQAARASQFERGAVVPPFAPDLARSARALAGRRSGSVLEHVDAEGRRKREQQVRL
jgi:hypothetical protein